MCVPENLSALDVVGTFLRMSSAFSMALLASSTSLSSAARVRTLELLPDLSCSFCCCSSRFWSLSSVSYRGHKRHTR